MRHERALSVAVLMELVRTAQGGGHVKCWEHLAGAAAEVPEIDLTVYVLGHRPTVEDVAANVRFVALRPVLSTRAVGGLVGGVDDSDLAPFHPGLARSLPRHEVWHATHTLTFGSTAAHLARRRQHPLVGSVHTDVPMLTQLYTRQVLQGLPGPLRRAGGRLRVDARAATVTRRRRDRVLRSCRHLLASNRADAGALAEVAPGAEVSMLRRGVDAHLFAPARRDRAWLAQRCGVPVDTPLVLFVGRIDVTKGAPLLADAVGRLRAGGMPAHLVLAGSGAATGPITRRLGRGATLLGRLPQAELGRVYASCDVLAFPSRSETAGNVVVEAMAAGTPAVLPRGSRTQQWLASPGRDGVLVDRDDAGHWAAALAALLGAPERLRAMGRAARETARRRAPSWLDVLREDLVPVWQSAAGRALTATAGVLDAAAG